MNLLATYISGAFGMIAQAISASSSRADGNGTSSALLDASKGLVGSVFEALGSVPEGLTEPEVQERLETYGRNTVAHERATAWPRMLLNNFRNPFILVLFVLGSVSYATGDLKGPAVVSVMVIVSVVMRLFQEFRSSRAAEALRAMVRTTATVIRRYPRDDDTEGAAVSLAEMPPTFFLWLVATLLTYGALTQLVKTWYIRRFHAWL